MGNGASETGKEAICPILPSLSNVHVGTSLYFISSDLSPALNSIPRSRLLSKLEPLVTDIIFFPLC